MSNSDSRRPVHHPDTVYRVFSDEAVVISPTENTVRMLNATASRVWELADGSRTLDEIAEQLALEFAVETATARNSVADFVNEMVGKGLLVWQPD